MRGVMPRPKTYRLDPSWIARRNRRVRQRVLVEIAVFLGLITLSMTMGVPLIGFAAVLAVGIIVGDLYLMSKRSRWDAAARIEVSDAGLQFHSLAYEPIMLHLLRS